MTSAWWNVIKPVLLQMIDRSRFDHVLLWKSSVTLTVMNICKVLLSFMFCGRYHYFVLLSYMLVWDV